MRNKEEEYYNNQSNFNCKVAALCTKCLVQTLSSLSAAAAIFRYQYVEGLLETGKEVICAAKYFGNTHKDLPYLLTARLPPFKNK